MSTIKEIIARVDEIKPNDFSEPVKTRWLATLEGKIAADVMLMDIVDIAQLQYIWPEDQDTEPMVRFPHDDVYDLWLMAQIDLANGEYNKASNSMALYNESYSNFVLWFANTYDPAQGYVRRDEYAEVED